MLDWIVGETEDAELISVYTEAAPLHDNKRATGLNRVLNPLLECISSKLSDITVLPMDRATFHGDINPHFVAQTVLLGNRIVLLEKLIGRTLPFACGAALRVAVTAAPHGKVTNSTMVVVGASYQTLVRGAAVANRKKSHLNFYIVDDFVEASAHAGRPLGPHCLEIVRRTLQNAHHIWCITDDLCDRISGRFNVDCEMLPLPYTQTNFPIKSDKPNQFIFVGSINYLYKDALLMFIAAIEAVNARRSTPLTLRLTQTEALATTILGRLPDIVQCDPINERSSLLSEIRSSRAAVLPCSFSDTYRAMVESSFPSKTLDYLEAAKDIVLISPPYSSTARYFCGTNIVERLSDLSEIVSYIEKFEPIDKKEQFASILEDRHSLARIKRCLSNLS